MPTCLPVDKQSTVSVGPIYDLSPGRQALRASAASSSGCFIPDKIAVNGFSMVSNATTSNLGLSTSNPTEGLQTKLLKDEYGLKFLSTRGAPVDLAMPAALGSPGHKHAREVPESRASNLAPHGLFK